jgi:hypothetical protein
VIPATATAVADPDGKLILENKNPSTWLAIPDTRFGVLSYYSSGATFTFAFLAEGLEVSTAYSLIYYANPWPGNNPGKLIGTGTSLADGTLAISGIPNLDMSLPTPPDSNMVVNHCGVPNNYLTCFGAKIWLVPSDCYSAGTNSISTWSPTRFLFETNLINYIDTDVPGDPGDTVAMTATVTEPASTIGLTVSPQSIAFGSVEIGSCSANFPITLTNTGTVPIKVTALASIGFYTDCLKIDTIAANSWVSTTIIAGGSLIVNAKVCINTTAYAGTQTGSVSFLASFTPTP